ncbi:hypothetical protein CKAN_01271200 [Cinnamomum micranthum f. kanehirae]|uniref:Uncharacterized protein n=1 Tax=Cinnamomum micranthum f. kanehirae TaxID=337451 RepID=A0A443NZL4_9MAGN|nr:hypothetical protein CKAN_01271200 [Cinnamomum micranthum f. kanehirae]
MAAPLRLLLTLNTAFCPYDSPIKAPYIFTQNPNFFKPSSPSSLFKPKWVDTISPHHCRRTLSSKQKWLCACARRDEDSGNCRSEVNNVGRMFGSDEENISQVPTQAQSLVEGSGTLLVSEPKPSLDLDYLQELLAIQQKGPRAIGFFGTRNMGFMHQQLIEVLSYAMVITKNHIFTSGASGTNAAVIRGALRAEQPDLLTVILPQSLKMQPPESQELLSKVKNVIEKPHNDHLPLIEASRLCNMDILSHVQQVICFAFHDSRLLMETCQEAKNLRKMVTLFYLD